MSTAPKIAWIAAEAERAKECEQAFQNGGPRVYVFDESRRMPCSFTGARAVLFAGANETVYARRKRGRKYSWFYAKAQS